MPYANSLTIVLGADGFIGRHLAATWLARGWPVYLVCRSAGDFTDPEVPADILRQAPSAARILHAVTKQRTGAIQYQLQAELLRDNARIHLNVLEAWRRHQPQAKLISLGSSCIYPESNLPVPENSFRKGPPHPSVRGYALAKELLVTGCEIYGAQYSLTWLHCVLATLYGPGAHTEQHRSHFMAALIARAVAAKRAGSTIFEVWGNPATVRDLLYVSDQIDAIIAADGLFENQIINCTSGSPVSIGVCMQSVLEALSWDARIVHPAGSFQGAPYKSLDSGVFASITQWRPQVTLRDGIRCVLDADFEKDSNPL